MNQFKVLGGVDLVSDFCSFLVGVFAFNFLARQNVTYRKCDWMETIYTVTFRNICVFFIIIFFVSIFEFQFCR